MRLFLVDTSIYVFRAWYGPEPRRVSRGGEPDQAFVGFSDFVYRLLAEQAPAHIACAFDQSLGRCERRRIYPDYKANRAAAPDELKRQFGWCREWLEALGIACLASAEWEADDLIGSLAHFHRRPGMPVAFLTADKDLAQLVEDGDLWWSFLDDKRLDYRGVCRKFGVEPRQIAALLALTGDKIDNIPGIPGVGPRTAARLLRKYGDLDNLRRHLHEVGGMKFRYAGRVQRALLAYEAQLDMALELTRIRCRLDAARAVDVRRGPVEREALDRLMGEHAFEPARRARWAELLDGSPPREARA